MKKKKVVTALHPEKAEVGKKYWYSDSITWLKRKVEDNETYAILKNFESPYFEVNDSESLTHKFFLLYPYEELPKQRMTNEQLAEWLAKGNGLLLVDNDVCYTYYEIRKENLEIESTENFLIRPFGQTNWIEPTVDIYERDCKGGEK